MSKIIKKQGGFFDKNSGYFTTLGYIGGIYGYIRGTLDVIHTFIESIKAGSAVGVLFSFISWHFVAMLTAVIFALLSMFVLGIILFLPYKAIQIFIRGLKAKND